jgi:phage shock protein A
MTKLFRLYNGMMGSEYDALEESLTLLKVQMKSLELKIEQIEERLRELLRQGKV